MIRHILCYSNVLNTAIVLNLPLFLSVPQPDGYFIGLCSCLLPGACRTLLKGMKCKLYFVADITIPVYSHRNPPNIFVLWCMAGVLTTWTILHAFSILYILLSNDIPREDLLS